jgi:ADP-heptose:LPS heptosyltransferase
MRPSAADEQGWLKAGEIYVCGDAVNDAMRGPRLPVTAYNDGWHPVEQWGVWASRRVARLTAPTALPSGAKVLVALRLHAPPGSHDARCVGEIGGVESAPRKLTHVSRWQLFEGETRGLGMLGVTLRALGVYGRPDPRELYVGLEAFGFCLAEDGDALQRQLRLSWALRARHAVSRLGRAFGRRERPGAAPAPSLAVREPRPSDPLPEAGSPRDLAFEPDLSALAPELAGRPSRELFRHHAEGVELRQLGREERTPWGWLPTLRGVEALRGVCLSREPIAELQIALNGFRLHRGPVRGYDMAFELDKRVRKYVFNAWCDVSSLPFGRYEIEFRACGPDGSLRWQRRQAVVVAAPLDPARYASSDRLVVLPAERRGSVEQEVNALPSVVRSARRAMFETPIRNVLVVRADQLGDLVCSVPALRRLRQILPEARFIGALSPANAELGRSLGLFEEIVVVDFPDDPLQRTRVMPLERQLELKRELAPYKFDLAIDLAGVGDSRPLLLLSGARYTFGFGPGEFRWLSAGFEGATRDPLNGHECTPHTTKLVGLVEWLGAISRSHAEVVVRADLDRGALAEFGIGAGETYVVLHTGARLAFSRWPRFGELAELILARTAHKVVMMADDAGYGATLPPALVSSPRFRLIDRRLSFDRFDALLSFCAGFVGNDSGPKHLAALRGAPVVSLHLARNNWSEWGQENNGFVISRRVPCAGCSLHHEPEDCGQDFACIAHIRTEEAFDALMRAMGGARPETA